MTVKDELDKVVRAQPLVLTITGHYYHQNRFS